MKRMHQSGETLIESKKKKERFQPRAGWRTETITLCAQKNIKVNWFIMFQGHPHLHNIQPQLLIPCSPCPSVSRFRLFDADVYPGWLEPRAHTLPARIPRVDRNWYLLTGSGVWGHTNWPRDKWEVRYFTHLLHHRIFCCGWVGLGVLTSFTTDTWLTVRRNPLNPSPRKPCQSFNYFLTRKGYGLYF